MQNSSYQHTDEYSRNGAENDGCNSALSNDDRNV